MNVKRSTTLKTTMLSAYVFATLLEEKSMKPKEKMFLMEWIYLNPTAWLLFSDETVKVECFPASSLTNLIGDQDENICLVLDLFPFLLRTKMAAELVTKAIHPINTYVF